MTSNWARARQIVQPEIAARAESNGHLAAQGLIFDEGYADGLQHGAMMALDATTPKVIEGLGALRDLDDQTLLIDAHEGVYEYDSQHGKLYKLNALLEDRLSLGRDEALAVLPLRVICSGQERNWKVG